MLIGSVCAYAYGNKLQEIVIMSMEYGIFSTFVRGLYATGMIVNLVMQLVPIQDVIESWEKPCFGIGGWINEDVDNKHMYVFDPT